MHLRARWYHKSRSALLCLSFFCVTLLREALVYFYSVYSLLRLQFISFRVTQSASVKALRHGSIIFTLFTDYSVYVYRLFRLQFTPFRVTQFFSGEYGRKYARIITRTQGTQETNFRYTNTKNHQRPT